MFAHRWVTSLVFGALAASSAVSAPVYSFYRITNNGNPDVGAQLRMTVLDPGSGQVSFKFENLVGTASSITDIYFDDGTLLGIASLSSSAGVSYSQGASPPNLPGGGSLAPAFVTTAGFLADSDSPVLANGVNSASEHLTITFDLLAGKTYADTLAALALAGGTGGLRVGLHVQGIGPQGGSDAYVNRTVPIPAPGAVLLGLAGLGVAAWERRRVA